VDERPLRVRIRRVQDRLFEERVVHG
jgi:hypothetical protein